MLERSITALSKLIINFDLFFQSLDHDNIVRYLNWFIDNKLNELFIAVEWAEKGDLKLVMKRAQEDEVSFQEKLIWKYIH